MRPTPYVLLQLGQFVESSRAVAESLDRDTEPVEQRHVQVRQRRVVRVYEVTAARDRARASAQHQRWQRAVAVAIAVAQSRPIEHDHVIEQRSVAIGRRPQLLEIPREQCDVIRLDPGALLELRGIALMM